MDNQNKALSAISVQDSSKSSFVNPNYGSWMVAAPRKPRKNKKNKNSNEGSGNDKKIQNSFVSIGSKLKTDGSRFAMLNNNQDDNSKLKSPSAGPNQISQSVNNLEKPKLDHEEKPKFLAAAVLPSYLPHGEGTSKVNFVSEKNYPITNTPIKNKELPRNRNKFKGQNVAQKIDRGKESTKVNKSKFKKKASTDLKVLSPILQK